MKREIELSKKVIEKITKRRKYLGLSQTDLAERMGCTKQQVSKWETQESGMRLETADKLCRCLGMTITIGAGKEE